MSITHSGVHRVIDITVEPVQGKDDSAIRWQSIRVTAEDGSVHTFTMYLEKTCEGIEPTPKRRVDDVPRQPALIPE